MTTLVIWVVGIGVVLMLYIIGLRLQAIFEVLKDMRDKK